MSRSPVDPPLSKAMLARLVLRWRRPVATAAMGAHLRRRQGHSPEFREHRAWQRGDDIRSIDWRASLRLPKAGDLLVRSFEAEERLTLAIVLDNRPDMALPQTGPKLLWGLWAVQALAALALEAGDEVILARLFEGAAEPLLVLSGAGGEARARAWAAALWEEALREAPRGLPGGRAGRADLAARQRTGVGTAVGPEGGLAAGPADGRSAGMKPAAGQSAAGHLAGTLPAFADLARLGRRLKPAGAVVLISDMLFADPGAEFARFARLAQAQRRSLSVVQLDSLRHETAILRAAGRFHLERPGTSHETLQQFEERAFAEAAENVAAHLVALRAAIHAGGLDWPAEPVAWPDPTAEDLAGIGLREDRQSGADGAGRPGGGAPPDPRAMTDGGAGRSGWLPWLLRRGSGGAAAPRRAGGFDALGKEFSNSFPRLAFLSGLALGGRK